MKPNRACLKGQDAPRRRRRGRRYRKHALHYCGGIRRECSPPKRRLLAPLTPTHCAFPTHRASQPKPGTREDRISGRDVLCMGADFDAPAHSREPRLVSARAPATRWTPLPLSNDGVDRGGRRPGTLAQRAVSVSSFPGEFTPVVFIHCAQKWFRVFRYQITNTAGRRLALSAKRPPTSTQPHPQVPSSRCPRPSGGRPTPPVPCRHRSMTYPPAAAAAAAAGWSGAALRDSPPGSPTTRPRKKESSSILRTTKSACTESAKPAPAAAARAAAGAERKAAAGVSSF